MRANGVCGLICCVLAACGAPPERGDPAPTGRNTDAAIAGMTLQCTADGPASPLTFARDGTVTGTLLRSDASGTWFVRAPGRIEVHIQAGSIGLRDVLTRSGRAWRGRNISCT